MYVNAAASGGPVAVIYPLVFCEETAFWRRLRGKPTVLDQPGANAAHGSLVRAASPLRSRCSAKPGDQLTFQTRTQLSNDWHYGRGQVKTSTMSMTSALGLIRCSADFYLERPSTSAFGHKRTFPDDPTAWPSSHPPPTKRVPKTWDGHMKTAACLAHPSPIHLASHGTSTVSVLRRA